MAVVQTLIGNIKGPQGATGPQGEQGVAGNAATITVGTTSTTAYGNPAQVTNVGSSSDAILNFVIPQGRTGESVTELDDLTLNTITTATAEYPQIAIGDTGSTIFGKIVKFFQDLVSKKVDTSAVVNNFTTTQAGYVADARTVNTLMDALSQVGGSSRSSGTQKSLTASTETEVASVLCEVSGKYIIHFSANLAEVNAGLRVYINNSVFIKSFSTAKTKSLFGYTNLSAGDIIKASIVPDNNMTYYADGQGNELLIILIQET